MGLLWQIRMGLFALPVSREHIAIPFHRCALTLRVTDTYQNASTGLVALLPVHARAVHQWEEAWLPKLPVGSPLVIGGTNEIVLAGPGTFQLVSRWRTEPHPVHQLSSPLEAVATLRPAGMEQSLSLSCMLDRVGSYPGLRTVWRYEGT